MDKGNNPWQNINWDNTLADIDKEFTIVLKEKNMSLLQLDTLPEPYTGCIDSDVFCLGMNPGEKDTLFEYSDYNRNLLLEYTQKTLSHSIMDNMWYHLKEHNGYCWWRKVTGELRNELKRNPQMFTIEFFPYHSSKGFSFPAFLNSYEYSNWLIRKAISDKKFILILRQKKKWLERINGLEYYEKIFYIDPRTAQHLVISKKNIVKGQGCMYEIDNLIKHL